jgi:aminopeptidase N
MPLLQATNAFQVYRKGAFAMYAVREYIGEKSVNLALQRLLKKFRPGTPPLPTSLDFYTEISVVTPDTLQYLLKDLFETNTFWELETKTVNAAKYGKEWQVIIDVAARKVQVDKEGIQLDIPMNDWIEIGVKGEHKRDCLYLAKHKIKTGINRIMIKVPDNPSEAGIDPNHLLIDTEIKNNVKQVAATAYSSASL